MQLYHMIPQHNIFHLELFIVAVSKMFATPHVSLINGFSQCRVHYHMEHVSSQF